MPQEIEIYQVQKNDTLKTIAEKIGMTDSQLRDFHNENCEKFGLMYFNSLIGIEKIIVPKNYKNPEQIWKETQKNLPKKTFQPDFYAENYIVNEDIFQLGQEKLELFYKLNLTLKEVEESKTENWIFEVQNSDFKKNSQKVDDKISSLALDCMKAISPIPFELSKNGGISGIFEFKNLKKKFKKERKEIEDFHIGEVSKNYLEKFQEALSDEEFFTNQLRNTLLNQLMFPTMNSFHKKDGFKANFHVMQNSFAVDCDFQTEYETKIKFIGKITEKCTLQELLRGIRFNQENVETLNGKIILNYTFNSKKTLTRAEAEISLFHEEELYLQHQLKVQQSEK